MTSGATGRLSGERFQRLSARIVDRYEETVKLLIAEYRANGVPPPTDPLTPYAQYQKLLGMRGAGDPAFWGDPRAQADLAKLELRFGNAPPVAGPGYAPQGVQAPSFRVLGATQTSQKLGEPPLQ